MTARSITLPSNDGTWASQGAKNSTGTVSRPLSEAALPDGAMDPAKAAKQFGDKLTFYEKKEIESYPEVYYVGQSCKNKVKAPTSGFNDGYDTENGEYTVVEGDHLAYRYEIICHLGTGAFGQVVKALDHSTGGKVAVKLIRNKKKVAHQAKTEVRVLEHIKEKDPFGKYSIVQMLDNFTFRSHLCIVYELLGTNLYDHMEKTDFYPMPLHTVRKVAARMLVALTFMWKENIIHCDLKPENVLYQTDVASDVVKVADLGSACYDTKCSYTYIQSRFYRAPEVILGIPYGRPIDLWSFGCILCELATGYPLFAGENEKDQLACIMEYLGKPPETMIQTSKKKKVYFDDDMEPKIAPNSKGRLRKPAAKTLASFLGLSDDDGFVSFISQFLSWDPDQRIPPRQAMKHPWIEEEFVFAVPKPQPQVTESVSANGSRALENGAATTASTLVAAAAERVRNGGAAKRPPSPAAVPGDWKQETAATPSRSRETSVPANCSGSTRWREESDANALSSPKRSRPAMLTFDVKATNSLKRSGRDGRTSDEIDSSSAKSLIGADHHTIKVSAPPGMREAELSGSQRLNGSGRASLGNCRVDERTMPGSSMTRAQPTTQRNQSGNAADSVNGAEFLHHPLRRTSLPGVAAGVPSVPVNTKGLRENSGKVVSGSDNATDSMWWGAARNGSASGSHGANGGAVLINARSGQRVNITNGSTAISPVPRHPSASTSTNAKAMTSQRGVSNPVSNRGGIGGTRCLTESPHRFAIAEDGRPPERVYGVTAREERAKTATFGDNEKDESTDGDAATGTARRRASEAFPRLRTTSFPLSSAPVVVTSGNNSRASRTLGDAAPPQATTPSSRRHEYAAQRQAQRRRETVMVTVPDNCSGDTKEPHLPPI